jgi:hypothetical protein
MWLRATSLFYKLPELARRLDVVARKSEGEES